MAGKMVKCKCGRPVLHIVAKTSTPKTINRCQGCMPLGPTETSG